MLEADYGIEKISPISKLLKDFFFDFDINKRRKRKNKS
jgi:hypothetical protein